MRKTLQSAVIFDSMTAEKNSRASRMRRQRGYHWEDTIVRRFNAVNDWKAFRLGSPSTALPDVLAVSTKSGSLFAIEAKSGTITTLSVPADQIRRCIVWAEMFGAYNTRRVVLAFKFLSKKRIGTGRYKGRQLREFFKVWDIGREPVDCICTYDGKVYTNQDGKRQYISLDDCIMPFM